MARGIERDPTGVFINCPFTRDYRSLHEAIVFTILSCGFRPRSALETGNSGDVRLDKIVRLIKESSYSVHDLSAVGLDATNGLPRFNMPFELGITIGLKKSTHTFAAHSLLVLEHEKYVCQKCLSDIAGQDLQAHGNDIGRLIPIVRNWLRTESRSSNLSGGETILIEFGCFQARLPGMCAEAGLDRDLLPFADLHALTLTWLQQASERAQIRPTLTLSAASAKP